MLRMLEARLFLSFRCPSHASFLLRHVLAVGFLQDFAWHNADMKVLDVIPPSDVQPSLSRGEATAYFAAS